jgi:dihydrodiol dehydrogenase / D-xylose 1-dehydrogenase (NADP)
VQDPEVDVVYVGTIHTQHLGHVKLALEAGKHVVCEKPLGINESQVKEMIDLARAKKCFLMEGMWTRFFPAIRRCKQALANGEVGSPKSLQADFGFVGPPEAQRLWDPSQAGGAMLDIGCYLVQAAIMIFGSTVPEQIACTGQLSETGVDTEGVLALTWRGKGSASLIATLLANTPEESTIVCSKGYVKIHGPPHCPTDLVLAKEEGRGKFSEEKLSFELPNAPDGWSLNFPNSEGFIYQVQAVEDCLAKGLTECPEYTLDESLALVKIMDKYREQVGVVYPL